MMFKFLWLFLLTVFYIESQNVRGEGVNIWCSYHVSIQNNGKHICGGAVIGDRWILTAANCFYDEDRNYLGINNFDVVLGLNKMSDKGDRYKIELVKRHSLYNSWTMEDNIAVIKTKEPIVFTALINPIPLCRKDNTDKDNTELTVCGWGSAKSVLRKQMAPHDSLQSITVHTLSYDKCKNFENFNQIKTICTNSAAVAEDEGGPLIFGHFLEEGCLAGVTSRHPYGKTIDGLPDVFAKVSNYVDWIDKAMTDTDYMILKLQK